jgi:hypothetical protein
MHIRQNIPSLWGTLTGLILVLLIVLLSGCGSSDNLRFATEYQAVFMDNGQVFFGRVQKRGPSFLTLRDVFYIQHMPSTEKRGEVRNLLLKRGGEWHGPDAMFINLEHVVLIEPVAPDSRVFQLIMQAKRPPAPAPSAKPQAPPAKPQAPAAKPQAPPAGK